MAASKNRFRKNVFYVRVTDAEKQMILDRAKRCHIRFASDYIRTMAIDGCILVVDDEEAIERNTHELSKIGVNINQIAHVANATGTISEETIKNLQNQMKEIWKMQRELLTSCNPYLDLPY